MQTQTLIDREWFDFCKVCGVIEPDGQVDGHVLCRPCSDAIEIAKAKAVGIIYTDDDTDTTFLEKWDRHHTICQYLTLAWNDLLVRRKSRAIVQEVAENVRCPYQKHGALYVPPDEIDQLAAEFVNDENTFDELGDAMLGLFFERHAYTEVEVDPRYDTGQYRARSTVWPAVNRDATYEKVAVILWERWAGFLPLQLAAAN